MTTKKRKRPVSLVFKIMAIVIIALINGSLAFYTVGLVYEEIFWNNKLSISNNCESDLADGEYRDMYDTLWLYRETGKELKRFWTIAYAYEDMHDCITYRRAETLGMKPIAGDTYAQMAEAALERIDKAAAEAELDQDRLIMELFAREAMKEFTVGVQNK